MNAIVTKANTIVTKVNATVTKVYAIVTVANAIVTVANAIVTKVNATVTKANAIVINVNATVTAVFAAVTAVFAAVRITSSLVFFTNEQIRMMWGRKSSGNENSYTKPINLAEIKKTAMTNEMAFKTNQLFKSVTYNKDIDSWFFSFSDNVNVSASEFWRLLKENKITLVSFDNGHQFGLPKPLDLVEEVTQQLTGKILIEIKVDKNTADLTLIMSDDIRIEIFITSAGYETYEFSIQGKTYIGLGSGELGIVELTDNPQIFTTRKLV